MKHDDRAIFFETLSTLMTRRSESHAQITAKLKEFSDRLFAAFETVLTEMPEHQVPGLGKARRIAHPAGGGREGFQIFIEDWSIIFVPMLGFARPNSLDEARIASAQFKEPCGRIGVFLTDDPQGSAFYDFVIFQDGSWFAWGYGWPKQQSDIESTDFEALALELIYSFVKDIFLTWHVRGDTSLAIAMDAKRRAYTFGLPGDERQGS